MRKAAGYALSLIAGILAGFFMIFNSVFSDSNGAIGERAFTFFLVIATYGIVGFALGMLVPGQPTLWSALTSLPAAMILLLYTIKERETALLSASYLLIAFISVYFSAYMATNSRFDNR